MFVCTTADVDERLQEAPQSELTIRDGVLSLWDIVTTSKEILKVYYKFGQGSVRSLTDFRALLMYAVEMPSRRKRSQMDVQKMVDSWVPIIRGLATAHAKTKVDECEFEEQTHLVPLLTAPVKQIREFYEKLVIALKNDPTIPFFVWSWFESWGEVVLKRAPDEGIKHLKTEIAKQIADMVEEQVKPDLKKAMIGALEWRSPESLEKIKVAVEKGGKARMVGRSSCLFLEVDLPEGTERVML